MYENIRNLALRMSTMFRSTYICEWTFSIMNVNKNKPWSNVTDQNLQAVLRIATRDIEQPNLDNIVKLIQSQPSHW